MYIEYNLPCKRPCGSGVHIAMFDCRGGEGCKIKSHTYIIETEVGKTVTIRRTICQFFMAYTNVAAIHVMKNGCMLMSEKDDHKVGVPPSKKAILTPVWAYPVSNNHSQFADGLTHHFVQLISHILFP